MYTIYADDVLIYTPDVEELCLYNIILTMEDNSAGTLIFNMASAHPAFYNLKKLATIIRVADNNQLIWKGRIISDNENIDNIKTIQCEGKLAFLNDSIFPEFDFSGAPDVLFQQMIENHNMQVGERQKFLIGNVTVKDKNDYIVRSSESALKTWKAVKEKCFQSTLGGHVQIRYEADGDYLDWLEDYQEISDQSISFGKNIIDLLVNTSATETYTAIRPQGALIDGKRVTIADVNDGRDYIVDEERAAEYGVIFANPDESIWDDVTLPQNLLRKSVERLKAGTGLKKTIEVRAIDLNLTDKQIEALKVCSYVRVVSKVHGIEAWYLLSKAEIYIDAPENTKYTLGAVKAALTDTNKQTKNAIEKVLNMSIPTEVSQLKNDKRYTTPEVVEEIIKESGVLAPVISVSKESDDVYILTIQTAEDIFETPNLIGKQGTCGQSAYDLAVQDGFEGTEEEWLVSLKGQTGEKGLKGEPGDRGQSAYDLAVQKGFAGTEEEWLATLKGKQGDQGLSAYELAVQGGFKGTVKEWLESLKVDEEKYLPINGMAKNSEKLGGYEVTKSSSKIWGSIPKVDDSGVLEIGKYIDFHESETDFTDFYIRVTARDGGLYIGDKKILVDGEAIFAKNGVANGDLTVKGGNFPLLNLVRNEYGETAAIQLTNGNKDQKGFLLEGYLKDSEGSERNFHIRDRILNKELFLISPTKRRVYDKDSDSLKEILVEGEALPSTGGTIASTTQQMLNLRYSGETGDAIISMFPNNFTNKCVTVQSTFSTLTNSVKFKIYQIMDGVVKQLFEVSDKSKDIHDPKTNTMKPIMVKGDSITPTVKETTFKIKNNELVITGFIGSTETDITDIIIKAYGSSNLNEGMRVGISTGNGVGYIQAQNFVIDCNRLTLEETRLLQSFTSIRFSKANDSSDYPLLMPATQDFEAGFFFTNKDGRSNITTKAKILSDSAKNFFQYDLPPLFKNDKDSGTKLKLESKEWLVATGIDIKKRG